MVLFTLISQLPLISLESPEDLVNINKVTLMAGAAIYLTLAGLLYSGKLPESIVSQLPDYKYIGIMIIADLLLYVALHKFQYGIFPVFSLPEGESKGLQKEHQKLKSSISSKKKGRKHRKESEEAGEAEEDDQVTTNEFDEISSVFKKPPPKEQKHDQDEAYPVPIDDISDHDYHEDEEPHEVSMADQDFFQKKDKTVVENWDVEDFSNMEYINEHV